MDIGRITAYLALHLLYKADSGLRYQILVTSHDPPFWMRTDPAAVPRRANAITGTSISTTLIVLCIVGAM